MKSVTKKTQLSREAGRTKNNTKNYWKWKKEIVSEVARGNKHYLRKSADRKVPISSVSGMKALLICTLQSADFLG